MSLLNPVDDVDVAQLIALIQDQPHLFDLRDKNYKNNKMKETTWEDISLAVGTTVDNCKKLWKNLRDRFSKEKRGAPSGSEAESEWTYYNNMLFYSRYRVPRKTTTTTTLPTEFVDLRTAEDETGNIAACTSQVLFLETEGILPAVSIGETPRKTPQKRKRQESESAEIFNVAKEILNRVPEPAHDGVNEKFCKYICARLNELSPEEARAKRKECFQIIET